MSNEKRNELIQKYKGKLNIKKLKEFKGYENISDSEATELLKTLDVMAEILYDCYLK